MTTQSISVRAHEWRYWHIHRPLGKLGRKLVKAIPDRLKYWVMIDSVAWATTHVFLDRTPDQVSAMDAIRAAELRKKGDR